MNSVLCCWPSDKPWSGVSFVDSYCKVKQKIIWKKDFLIIDLLFTLDFEESDVKPTAAEERVPTKFQLVLDKRQFS